MAVLKDCHQRLLRVLLKWWLSLKIVVKDCRKFCWSDGCLERLEKRLQIFDYRKNNRKDCISSKTREKDWRKDCRDCSSLRACRTLKTLLKRKFFTSPIDPFVTSCVSEAQNCGKRFFFTWPSNPFVTCRTFKTVVRCDFLRMPERPFRHFGRLGRPKQCSKLS